MSTGSRRLLIGWLVGLVAVTAACSASTATDSVSDSATDTASDAQPDAVSDAVSDAQPDTVSDTASDTASDTVSDTVSDTAPGTDSESGDERNSDVAGTTPGPAPLTPAEIGVAVGDAVWRVDVDGCGIDSTGSAFAISDSLVITNWHVVEFDMAPTLTSRTGDEVDGEVIGFATDPDVAVIRAPAGSFDTVVEFVDADHLVEGDPIVSIGYPVPYSTFTVAPGWATGFVDVDGTRVGVVSDESSDFGSSGGPLFDLTGRVVAVVTEFTPGDGLQPNGVSYTRAALGDVIDGIIDSPEPQSTDCTGVEYGTDADLDQLWDLCADGRYWSCDSLSYAASTGTAYSDFADTCGERIAPTNGYCVDQFEAPVPYSYGDDDVLDGLWDECDSAADAEACDRLYLVAPIGSDYEVWGYTCGGRFPDAEELCVDLM